MNHKRTAVITGGGTGIGFAISERMLELDTDVIIIGRRESVLIDAANKLGGNVRFIQADVSNRAEVENAVRLISDMTDTIDVLVNNAGFGEGITTSKPLPEAEAVWDRVVSANLKGAFLMTVAISPLLRRPGGRIINISSIAAYTGGSKAGNLAYAAAKSGLHGLTFSTARELSSQGITVNAIAPGIILDTDFFGGELSSDRINQTISQIPAGRTGTPKDIAYAAGFLASPEASYINGEILNVNGGWLFGK